MEQSVAVSSPSEIQVPVSGAGFWVRAGAQIIDTIIHNLIWFVAAFLFGIAIRIFSMISGIPTSQIFANAESTSAMAFVLALIGSIFYHAISEYMYGASLGKLIFRLHVKNEHGQPISIKAALIRSCTYFIDALFFGLVAYYNMQTSPRNQRLGDKWAKTVVVERTKLAPSQIPSGWQFLLAFAVAILVDGLIAVFSTVLALL
ncbi:MAG TPA: RDD family protein [Candidatus Nitrosotenuis sp.]|nr:RDD family protein [Candidatus Nitrosotenuis sp.]